MKNKIVSLFTSLIAVFIMTGCTAMDLGMKFITFEGKTQESYAAMMKIVYEQGDPAQAMMKEYLITDEDLTEDDIFEEMKSLAGDFNMRFVGEKNMFRLMDVEKKNYKEAGYTNLVVHARIAEFCSLSIAKEMLNHSRFYGGFMPCRVIYVEYEDGRRYLVSMDMTLALYGGTDAKPINPKLMEQMKGVMNAMENIPLRAAGYETQEDADKALVEYYKANNINERMPEIAE